MDEAAVNRVISSNFKRVGFSFKIPDPQGQAVFTTVKNPFDGFAVTEKGFFYFETKLIKSYQAFAFSSIREHQIESLKNILEVCEKGSLQNVSFPIIILAVWEPRKVFDLFFFHISYILKQLESGKKSITKKELLALKDTNSLQIKKELFDIERIGSVLLC